MIDSCVILDEVGRRHDKGEPETRSLAEHSGRPRLIVLGADLPITYPLPPRGTVVIGRDRDCDVRVDDPSLSRRHVRLRVGDGFTIEDLGSSNGTQLRGATLSPGEHSLALDEIVTLGAVSIIVQRQPRVSRHRAVWGHGYFELRLAEECTRAAKLGATFGLIRVRAPEVEDAIERIGAAIRDIDVLGAYAPGEWEVIVIDATTEQVEAVAGAICDAIPGARTGVAMFPGDGRDAWTLGALVGEQLDQPGRAVEREIVVPASGPMRALYDLVDRIAVGDISVLVVGETGTGKEVIAEAIHRRSRRMAAPFLRLNCASLPETLVESELFGHEKGAFTGAATAKPGLLEQASMGSVFLDEIAELSPGVQAKLLRVLEQRELLRVGGLKPIPIDVRFIAATHRDLEAAVGAGRFREDLYFRIAGITLSVPPLRERPDEIEPLARLFVRRAAATLGRPAPKLASETLAALRTYRWPGNIRELRNVMDRATLLCDTTIEPSHLPQDRMSRPSVSETEGTPLDEVRDRARELEREAIAAALARCDGNQTKAAALLGISRRALTNKLTQFGFIRPRKRS